MPGKLKFNRGTTAEKPTLESGEPYFDQTTKQLKIGLTSETDLVVSNLTSDQSAALAGTSGTPSSTNKFVTDEDPRLQDAWDDLRIPATAINPPGVASDPDYDTTNMGYSFAVNDELQIIAQMPHAWKEGTEINPHVHFKQTSGATVGWQISYRIYNNNEDISALAFTNLALDQQVFTWSTGTLSQIQEPTAMIDMTGKRISALLEIKLKRIADSAPTNVVLTEFDIHYQIDSNGSTQEFTK